MNNLFKKNPENTKANLTSEKKLTFPSAKEMAENSLNSCPILKREEILEEIKKRS